MSDPVTKQPYEKFPIAADFTDDLEPVGETIVLGSSEVLAFDKDGNDSGIALVLSDKALATNPDRDDAMTDGSLQIVVAVGLVTESPYNLSFRIETNTGMKYEKDVKLKVKELTK